MVNCKRGRKNSTRTLSNLILITFTDMEWSSQIGFNRTITSVNVASGAKSTSAGNRDSYVQVQFRNIISVEKKVGHALHPLRGRADRG